VTSPSASGDDDVAGVVGGAALHAGPDQRRLCLQQRDRLAHHVRPHQRAVGVVVLEERDQRRRDRPDLVRRDVHQVYVLGSDEHELTVTRAAGDAGAAQLARLRVDLRVGLGDHQLLLLVGVQVDDLVGHQAVLDGPVGGGDEAVLGDLRV